MRHTKIIAFIAAAALGTPALAAAEPTPGTDDGIRLEAHALGHLIDLAMRIKHVTSNSRFKNSFQDNDGLKISYSRLWACRDENGALRLSLMLRRGEVASCREAFNLDVFSDEKEDLSLKLGTLIREGGEPAVGPAVNSYLTGTPGAPQPTAKVQRVGSEFTIDTIAGVARSGAGDPDAAGLQHSLAFWSQVRASDIK